MTDKSQPMPSIYGTLIYWEDKAEKQRLQIKKLKAKNKRLRDALGNIIGSCDCCHDRCDSCTIHITIAKEAREG